MFDHHHALSVADLTVTGTPGEPVVLTQRTPGGPVRIAEWDASHAAELGQQLQDGQARQIAPQAPALPDDIVRRVGLAIRAVATGALYGSTTPGR